LTGLFLGAIPTALGIMVIGSLVRAPVPQIGRQAVVVVVAVILLLREIGVFTLPIPQNARLVPQFVTRVPFWGALQFGAEMGTGMRTYSPTGLPHIVAVAVLLLASWPEAVLAGAGFALGRAVMLVSFLLAPDKESADNMFTFSLPRLGPLFALLLIPAVAALVIG
jgi:hypothetical protein